MRARFAAMAALAVAALPLCASIPRGYAGSGVPQHSDNCNRTDGAGNSIRYTYDALNRLVFRSVPSVPSVDRFSYDAVGNLLTASNETAHLAFSYDAMNRLASSETRVAGQVFGVSYAYDPGGLCTNVVYPGGRAVRYGYDADGRVTHVTDWAGRAWTFTRDPAGRLTAASCPNGVTGAWTYDANHRVSGWSYDNGSTFAGRVITRDAAGVKTKEQVTAGLFPNPQNPRRAINTFDAADRLVSAQVVSGTNTHAETYLYDLNGALTNIVSGSESVFDAAYNALGQLSSLRLCASALNHSYDPLGNRIVSGDRILIPDHADSLKRPLIEADAAGNPIRYYIWGGGQLLGFINAVDDSLTVAHSDEYGSVVALTDVEGNVLHQACYGPYGEDWGSAGANPTPFAWLGGYGVQKLSGSGCQLYLTRHRLYSASLCRFLSQDPLGLDGGPNLYAYCLGNPLAYIDPQGLAISAAANYVERSFSQLIKGNYADGITALGTGMQVLTGVLNLDLLADVRDNWYNVTHWSDVPVAQKVGDAVGLLPVVGALKYADEVGGVIKGSSRAADAASAAAKTPLWTSTKSKTAIENAFDHWKSHGAEFPEFQNAKQYVEGTKSFFSSPPSGTLTKVRPNGDKLFYNPANNTFGVQAADGAPRTMFRPTDGINYWNRQ